MTENQLYSMQADLFDNSSSNSSNLLKLDIYPSDFIISHSNSNSNSGLGSLIGLSSLPRSLPSSQSPLSPQQNFTNTSNTSMDSLRENPMLASTASIQIPQRGNNITSSNILTTKYNSQPRMITADFSEFGLDALEAHSLSPNLLQDSNSLGGGNDSNHQLHNHLHHNNSHHGSNSSGITLINNISPNNGNSNSIGGTHTNSSVHHHHHNNSLTTTPTAAITNGDAEFILYEIPASGNSNTMWSDIGNAMITKSEPFQMDDDYIFEIDKTDLMPGPTLAELNHETLLEDLMNDGDNDGYLFGSSPHNQLHQLQSSSVGSGSSNLHSPENSGSMPPQQLLQQNQNIYHNNQHQHNQQLQQNQPTQHQPTTLHLHINRNDGNRYDDQNNTGGSSSPYDFYHSTPTKSFGSTAAFSPGSQASSSPLLLHSITPPPPHHRSQLQQNRPNRTALHDLLAKKDYSQSPDRHLLGQSVPGPSTSHSLLAGTALSPASSSGFGSGSSGRKPMSFTSGGGAAAAAAGGHSSASRLSSSAPTHLGLEQIWQRREPRQHLLSTGSLAEAESFSSISTGSVLSPEGNDFSHDEGYSDYDSDHYEDYSSDGSDNDDDDSRKLAPGQSSKNKERYFWQYNVQAKGPKGQRLVIKTQIEDPHVLNEVTDPVFSPNCSVRGIKHSGKARKGDGNDLTPNPRKLHVIGKELDKLGRTINDMIPVSELPINVRPKSRKEKNKLASRACRLKKKAQHEANKIKLYGLEIEHKKLLNGISDCKRILAMKYQNQSPNQNQSENTEELNSQFDRIAQKSTTVQIAGGSTDFVNKILDKVKAGQPSGGLEELKNM